MASDEAVSDGYKKFIARQYKEGANTQGGAGAEGYEACGPPYWDKNAWDRFKAQYGFWPFGYQEGTYVAPSNYQGCPDWAYERMGKRPPPVEVVPGSDFSQ